MLHENSHRSSAWILTAMLILVVSPALVVAQDDPGAAPEDDSAMDQTDFAAIDELLEQGEEVISAPGTYAYDPGSRRDPFRSLRRLRALEEPQRERPDGPAGLLIDEIEVEGVFILQDGPVAQVESASQETSFLLRPGDQLWDGDVVSISLEEVVFKQSVNDPTALKPFREVVKRLN